MRRNGLTLAGWIWRNIFRGGRQRRNRSNGLTLAGWIWLIPQIVQGVLLLYLPFWRFLSSQVKDTNPATYGALMLLIAAGCLIPVAVETWRAGNRLLGVGTVAAVTFGLIGALATLSTSSVDLAILWAGLNLYPFLIALAFIFTGQYAFGAIRRRLTLHSQVSVTSDRSKEVTRASPPASQGYHIEHFLWTRPPRPPLPRWHRITHFFGSPDQQSPNTPSAGL